MVINYALTRLFVCSDPFYESRVDDGLVEGKNYICFFKTWRK